MKLEKIAESEYFQLILYQIESRIVYIDNEAANRDIRFTDSQIRSCIQKTLSLAKGKTPKSKNNTTKDEMLSNLVTKLDKCKQFIKGREGGGKNTIPTKDWIISLKTIRQSIERRSQGDGSRAYLDFIKHHVPLPNDN